MARKRHRATGRLARTGALPALVLAAAAQGQVPGSVQDYQLPPSAPKPSPTAAGPVDTDHPVAAPTNATPSPPPAIALPAPTQRPSPRAAEPAPRPETQPRTRPQPTQSAAPAPAPAPEPTPTAEAVPTPAASVPVPAVEPSPAPIATAEPAPEAAEAGSLWPWLAGGAAAVLALAGFLYRRRRGERGDEPRYEPPAARQPNTQPEPSAPAALPPAAPAPRRETPPPAAPAPPPLPEPAFSAADAGQRPLEMQLEARHLSRALVNATLAYRLTLTNRTDAPLGPLRIAGDIVSAHASLSAQEQLAPADAALATIHEVPALAAGDAVVLSGELRLPIASILPIQSGGARVFVPLARFRADVEQGIAVTRVFVIGQASPEPGGALRPFPLDRGPGIDRGLGQRELELPA